MKTLIEFLSLRPVFTREALTIVWYLYLVATVVQVGQYLMLLFASGQIYANGSNPQYYISLLPPILFALAHLALVRLFLEMALQFIEKRTVQL